MAGPPGDDLFRSTLAAVAPGTPFRDGLERILRGHTGALIILGHDKVVEGVCTGGFELDVEFSATRLRELAKMDGAIVLSSDLQRVVRAAVHLVPDPTIHTEESGTRHRTAERVAKQTAYPVISVSQSMHIIAMYVAGRRYVLDGSAAILSRANQALATLERYKQRLDAVAGALSALEIEDLVTVRDAISVSQRLEMVRRIADEIEGYVVELGADGRLLSLQLEELMAGVEIERELTVRDYLPHGGQGRDDGRGARRTVRDVAHRPARPDRARARDRFLGRRRHPGPADQPARLPDAGQGAPTAPHGRRPPRRPLRHLAEAARRRGGRPAGGRGRRRDSRPRRPRGPVPPGRVEHPRTLRLTGGPCLPVGTITTPLRDRHTKIDSSAERIGAPRIGRATMNAMRISIEPATRRPASAAAGPDDAAELAEAVLDWFSVCARDLPWRRPDTSAWGVLVSEVMLQQTPVSRVQPVWEAWLARWPAAPALAREAPGEAVRAWGRLGYPRRALRLHQAAVSVTERHAGTVPDDLDELLALPGVGAYTARAVATFAYRQRHAVVDVNVRRFFARAVEGTADGPPAVSRRDLLAVERLLPDDTETAARTSAAFMELGALVCVARAPRCQACPVSDACAWRSAGAPPSSAPARRPQGYAGTDRQVRGRLLAVLRDATDTVPAVELDAVWDEPVQRGRALAGLLSDGLVVEVSPGVYALPDGRRQTQAAAAQTGPLRRGADTSR